MVRNRKKRTPNTEKKNVQLPPLEINKLEENQTRDRYYADLAAVYLVHETLEDADKAEYMINGGKEFIDNPFRLLTSRDGRKLRADDLTERYGESPVNYELKEQQRDLPKEVLKTLAEERNELEKQAYQTLASKGNAKLGGFIPFMNTSAKNRLLSDFFKDQTKLKTAEDALILAYKELPDSEDDEENAKPWAAYDPDSEVVVFNQEKVPFDQENKRSRGLGLGLAGTAAAAAAGLGSAYYYYNNKQKRERTLYVLNASAKKNPKVYMNAMLTFNPFLNKRDKFEDANMLEITKDILIPCYDLLLPSTTEDQRLTLKKLLGDALIYWEQRDPSSPFVFEIVKRLQ